MKPVLLSLLIALAAPALPAASYFVNFNAGNNNNPGTSGSPWKTAPGMNGSLANSKTVSPGDTVYLAPGQVWAATITGSGAASGLLTTVGGVTYKADTAVYNPDGAASGTKAILRATGTMNNAIVQFRDHPTFETVIDNLELDGNNKITQGIDINHRYSIETSMTGAWKKILNCYLHDMLGNMAGGAYKYGISARTNVENIWIENTEVFNPPREAIVMYSDAGTYIANVVIRHCFVHGDSSDGQPRGSTATGQYKNGSGYCLKGDVRNALIEYSTAYNIRSQALFIFDNGAGSTPSNFTVRYNVFHSNGHSGDGGTGVCRITGDGAKTGNFYGNIVLAAQDLASNPGLYKDGSGIWTGNVYNNTIMVTNANAITLSGFSGNVKNNYALGGINGSGTKSNNITGSYAEFKDINNKPAAAFFAGSALGEYAPANDGLAVASGAMVNGGANLGTSYNGTIDSGVREASGAWEIGAYDGGATGGGGGGPDVTGPVISNLADTSLASTTGYVSWNTDESATYSIAWGYTAGMTETPLTGALSTAFNVRFTGLPPATLVYYQVTATDGSANATVASQGTFTTLALPTAPASLTATTISDTRVDLAYTNVSGESGYAIERSTAGGGAGFGEIVTRGANLTTYSDQALNASATYFWRVRSYVTRDSTTDYSAYSPEASATTQSPSDVTAPVISNRSTQAGSATSHYVTWSTNEAATGYVDYGLTTGYTAGPTATSGFVTQHSHRLTGLTGGTLYHYRPVATDAASNANAATDGTFTTLALPATPTGLTATANSDTQITLAWTDNAAGEDAYQVERSTVGGGAGFALVATLGSNATGYTDTGRSPATQYFYRVRAAVTRDGLTDYSAYAAEANDTTDASGPGPDVTPPVISNAAGAAYSSKSVTITADTDEAAIVTVEYGPDTSYANSAPATALGTSHSVRLLGYEAGAQVFWRIQAADAAGNPATPATGSTTTLAWPTAPSSFTATPLSPTRVDLAWSDDETGEDGYRIWRNTADNLSTATAIATTAANAESYSDTTGVKSTAYFYWIRAIITRDQIEDRSDAAAATATTLDQATSGQRPRESAVRRLLNWLFGR